MLTIAQAMNAIDWNDRSQISRYLTEDTRALLGMVGTKIPRKNLYLLTALRDGVRLKQITPKTASMMLRKLHPDEAEVVTGLSDLNTDLIKAMQELKQSIDHLRTELRDVSETISGNKKNN